jgi:hypothetical protein
MNARLPVALLAASVAALVLGAGPAPGFSGNFGYTGDIDGHPGATVGFNVKTKANGHRRVTDFTVAQVPITCSDSTQTTASDGYRFPQGMPVVNREFEGRGEWVVQLLDPRGSVDGAFRHHGAKASGNVKLRGELAGPGTHCHTGPLTWHVAKAP